MRNALNIFTRDPKRRHKAGIAAIIGGILLFGIIFTVGFGFFYTTSQDQQLAQQAARENSNLLSEQSQESLYSTGSLLGGNVTFDVNNTGINTILVGYFISDQSGNILQYSSVSLSGNPPACSVSDATLPCALDQGKSAAFILRSGYSPGSTYTFKAVTSRGTTVIGTYPTNELTSYSVNAIVASGLGSLEMIFSSFEFYNYVSTSPPVVNLNSPEPAAVTPFNEPLVMSAQITNNDPSGGTIVIDAHTDLWTFLSCSGGCGGQSLLAFYVVNVASNGAITSTDSPTFSPILLPFGATKTIYFASSKDLSTCQTSCFATQSVSDNYGEHDVFIIISGTLVSAKNTTLYSQNLPFASTFTSDNIATWSQSPTSCGNGTSTTFTLKVTNLLSESSSSIYKVVVQASSMSNILPQVPTGWSESVSSGTITWTASSNYITQGTSQTFVWSATSPIVNSGTQLTFPSVVTWNGGQITSQNINVGCYAS
ncbi:MAG: hypothetical protein PXY39_15000 [archaeon]|nr:hypothetical protein [archaeon]